ncbi:MAG: beta-ketoacyl-[acyl-carrier-protein] synthase family protein [Planctomycetota bacterium]|nr:MAG: beta-ketoacyl-[acyl-carrier-protein] synthase family protein [Planctomycetota bacterium]
MIDRAPEIVITGIGAASPIGVGFEAVRESLAAGNSGVRRLGAFDTPEFPVRIGAEVVDFEPKKHVSARKSLKVMSRSIQLAFASAQAAIDQAGLKDSGVEPDRIGVEFGADMMQVEPQELVDAFRTCVTEGKFDYAQWDERAMGEMFPLWMLKYLPNMPACHVAIAYDARGPNNTIVLAEASSLLAIAEGMRVIQRGAADAMIVGGTGSRIHPMTWAFRDNIQLHSPRTEQPELVSRPFDAGRDGMVYGEGAAAFVLETRQNAEARGARVLARILGFASRFEACTPAKTFPGEAIRASIRQAMAEAHLEPSEIGHVNAHGLSTRLHDQGEAHAIRDTLGDVPVTAMKSYFGNLGAGGGAVELLGTLSAFETGSVPRTLNYEQEDPQCPINVVREPLATKHKTAVVLNQTLMGQSLAMVLAGE